MEKGKKAANEITSSLRNLHLAPSPRSVAIASFPDSFSLSLKKTKPPSLVNLCLGFLGQYLEDIIADISEIAAVFPSDIKLALVAIARRRQLLNDNLLVALAEVSWKILDISGSNVTDYGLKKVAEICTSLQAVDISHCDKITATGVSGLICHCQSLEILRCGGSPRSESTARRCVGILKPKLNNVEEESWEELENADIGSGAPSLRWLVWPKVDEASKATMAAECPRIIVNPQPSPFGFRGMQVPNEALVSVALDYSIIDGIDPKTWAVSGAARSTALKLPVSNETSELPIAERFRLAFLERDARLAPKRAKNARQHKRRAEREYLMSSSSAKSIMLASQASKLLHHRS
ncbi:uncharacterized protein LOC122040959 isoform X1 [Zingiber officinale]|uniref:RNI-like superfamily protein n=1 Tax=Zingiber officinale TaxID=94328 RepID=A0A8J5HHM7_ZINOF|nr:uncharacterized protein LOC122040959 isoform X1 [Zingiber officinale]KAG6527546.1 hypothetical protein ZIOFF_009657 [Zingiber officinale]